MRCLPAVLVANLEDGLLFQFNLKGLIIQQAGTEAKEVFSLKRAGY
jgi:hypothetical protein